MEEILKELERLELSGRYERDLLTAEDLTGEEAAGVLAVADALAELRRRNYDVRMFASGLGVYLGEGRRDFWGACDLLGLRACAAPDARTADDITQEACMADVLAGEDEEVLRQAAQVATEYRGTLDQRPTVLDLSEERGAIVPLAQMLHILHSFGGVEELRGRRMAAVWVENRDEAGWSPAGPSLLKLLARTGLQLCTAFPEGEAGFPEEALRAELEATGGSYRRCDTLEEAVQGAHILLPLWWEVETPEPQEVQEPGWISGEELLASSQAGQWQLTRERQLLARQGTVFLGRRGEGLIRGYQVNALDWQRQLPYVTAAAILLAKAPQPVKLLRELRRRAAPRRLV